jgi:hypothetical protein
MQPQDQELDYCLCAGRDDRSVGPVWRLARESSMSMQAVQMVIIDLDDGSRGVFIGTPITADQFGDEDCTVEQVWFTNIHMIPKQATLEQLVQMALAQIQSPSGLLQ